MRASFWVYILIWVGLSLALFRSWHCIRANQHPIPERRAASIIAPLPFPMPTDSRPTTISQVEILRQLRGLGVKEGGVILVHTSFRAVRPVEGGPDGLIDALLSALGPQGTLVMPSWSGLDDEVFDAVRSPASPDLGAVADIFWRRPGAVRSGHCFAFAAIGPLADHVVQGPLPLPPHIPESPVGQVHKLDGQILLLGVRHSENTTIHLAELIAGVPYGVPRFCIVPGPEGPTLVRYLENDHCCERFTLADTWLREKGQQAEGFVGHASARLIGSRDLVATVTERLRDDPLVFLHPEDELCGECREARASIAQ